MDSCTLPQHLFICWNSIGLTKCHSYAEISLVVIMTVRGRRKTLQKLAKRRAFVWGGGGLDRLRKASFKKKKKKMSCTRMVDYARCAPPGPAANRVELDRAASLIKNSFLYIFVSFDTVILTLLIISPSRLFLSSPAWFVIFHFFFQLGLLFPKNSWVHSFFLPSYGKSKSTLPFLGGTLKPVLRFPFVSGVREEVEIETNVIRFASFLRTFATAPNTSVRYNFSSWDTLWLCNTQKGCIQQEDSLGSLDNARVGRKRMKLDANQRWSMIESEYLLSVSLSTLMNRVHSYSTFPKNCSVMI